MSTLAESWSDPGTVAADPVPDGEDGLLLGRYRLGRRLGSGAFATVFAARDERLDRPVAIKVLARERVDLSRFAREARAAARLQHPGIVTLYEAAVDDDGAYLVSELVRGSTLEHALAGGELSDRDILEIVFALADALAHAHAHAVVHRDVKPQNVLIPARRGGVASAGLALAKLTDFGVAQLVDADSLTRTGDVVGTAAYMSPEQAEGRPTGPETDLYSLALITYEALTGVNPVIELLRHGRGRRLGTYLPPLRRQRADLPRCLGAAVDQALRPRASERGTLAELRAALLDSVAAVDDAAGVVGDARTLGVTRPFEARTGEMAPAAAPWGPMPPDAGPGPRPRPGITPRGLFLVGLSLGVLALGAIGLAAAWPAVVSSAVRGLWRRAVMGALAAAWIAVAGALGPVDFLFRLNRLDGAGLESLAIVAGVWAAAAAVGPHLIRGVAPTRDLLRGSMLALASAVGVALAAAPHTTGLLLGALVGWLVWTHRALLSVISVQVASRRLA